MFIPMEAQDHRHPSHIVSSTAAAPPPPAPFANPAAAAAAAAAASAVGHDQPSVAMTLQQLIAQGTFFLLNLHILIFITPNPYWNMEP